jgi:Glycosyl transferase family 2
MSNFPLALEEFRAAVRCGKDPAHLEKALSIPFVENSTFTAVEKSQIAKVISFFFGQDSDSSNLQVDASAPEDRMYLRNILSLPRPRISLDGASETQCPISASIGIEYDFLADKYGEWSPWKLLNFALLQTIKSTHRAAIVTTIRNEGISILEWIAHHRSMGFDQIFVYTNDNTDGSLALLEQLASLGIIRLIKNTSSPEVKLQLKVYEHSLHFLSELRDFEWVFYLDADEFFVTRTGSEFRMDEFFAELFRRLGKNPVPSAISFHWKWFGSENAFERTDGLLLERFVHSRDNEHLKTLSRVRDLVSMKLVHCPILFDGCEVVDSELLPLKPLTKVSAPAVYGLGQVNHYWNKSFQEFMIKRSRGRASVGLAGPKLEIRSFFEWGANGIQGNADPPDPILVEQVRAAHEALISLTGIPPTLAKVKESFEVALIELDAELDIRGLFQNHGISNNETTWLSKCDKSGDCI